MAAFIGDNGGGFFHGRDKIGRGHVAYQNFPLGESVDLFGILKFFDVAGGQAGAGRVAGKDEFEIAGGKLFFVFIRRLEGSDGSGLDNVDFAARYGPLDVLREKVVALDLVAKFGQFNDLVVGEFSLFLQVNLDFDFPVLTAA